MHTLKWEPYRMTIMLQMQIICRIKTSERAREKKKSPAAISKKSFTNFHCNDMTVELWLLLEVTNNHCWREIAVWTTLVRKFWSFMCWKKKDLISFFFCSLLLFSYVYGGERALFIILLYFLRILPARDAFFCTQFLSFHFFLPRFI